MKKQVDLNARGKKFQTLSFGLWKIAYNNHHVLKNVTKSFFKNSNFPTGSKSKIDGREKKLSYFLKAFL